MSHLDKAWVRRILKIDSIRGRWSFRHLLLTTILAAAAAGTFISLYTRRAPEGKSSQVATVAKEQAEVSVTSDWEETTKLTQDFAAAMKSDDGRKVKELASELVKKIIKREKELEKALQNEDLGKANRTIHEIRVLVDTIGMPSLTEKVRLRIEKVVTTIEYAVNNRKLILEWDNALAFKRANVRVVKVEPYNLHISGRGFNITLRQKTLGTEIQGKTRGEVNLREVDQAIKESGMSKEQITHAKGYILSWLKEQKATLVEF